MVYDSFDDGWQYIDECLLDGICSQLCINFKEIYYCSGAPSNWIAKVLERRFMFVVTSTNRIDKVTDDGENARHCCILMSEKGFHWNMFTSTSTMS